MGWVNVDERLPNVFDGKFIVKTSDEMVFPCYFYSDKMAWIAFYGQNTCYWWNVQTLKPVFNVVKWMEKEKKDSHDTNT